MTLYLDHNATSPLRPAARDAINAALDLGATNASSVHSYGRAARKVVEDARASVATLVGASPAQIVFNSGATEGNNTVLQFYAGASITPTLTLPPSGGGNQTVLVSATSHASIIEPARALGAEIIPATPDGLVDIAALEQMIRDGPAPALISVLLVNNETGVIQPMDDIVRLARHVGAAVHVDAVQAAGKIPVDMRALGVDVMTISAHKIGGPQGVGAMVMADAGTGACRPPPVWMRGGGQERSLRPGTENVAGIAGFGAAAVEVLREMGEAGIPSPLVGEGGAPRGATGEGIKESVSPHPPFATLEHPLPQGERESSRFEQYRTQIEKFLKTIRSDIVIFGAGVPRVPNTVCFAVPGHEAQTMLMQLDLAGIAVSSGSACSSGKVRESHVLRAMGVPPALARGALRVSMGWTTTEREVVGFCERISAIIR